MLVVEDEISSAPAAAPASSSLPSMKEQVMVLQQTAVYSYEQLDILCATQSSGKGSAGEGGGGGSSCHDLDGAGSILTLSHLSGDTLPLNPTVNDAMAGTLGPGWCRTYKKIVARQHRLQMHIWQSNA